MRLHTASVSDLVKKCPPHTLAITMCRNFISSLSSSNSLVHFNASFNSSFPLFRWLTTSLISSSLIPLLVNVLLSISVSSSICCVISDCIRWNCCSWRRFICSWISLTLLWTATDDSLRSLCSLSCSCCDPCWWCSCSWCSCSWCSCCDSCSCSNVSFISSSFTISIATLLTGVVPCCMFNCLNRSINTSLIPSLSWRDSGTPLRSFRSNDFFICIASWRKLTIICGHSNPSGTVCQLSTLFLLILTLPFILSWMYTAKKYTLAFFSINVLLHSSINLFTSTLWCAMWEEFWKNFIVKIFWQTGQNIFSSFIFWSLILNQTWEYECIKLFLI